MGSQMPSGITQIGAAVPHLLTARSRSAKAHQRWGKESRGIKTGWGWATQTGAHVSNGMVTLRSSRTRVQQGTETAGTCLAGPAGAGLSACM